MSGAGEAGARPGAEPTTLGAIVAGHRLGLVASAVLAVVGTGCSLAPYLAVYAVTVTLFAGPSADIAAVGWIAWWTAVALVVRAIANGLSTHVGHVAAYRILGDLRRAIAAKLQVLPLGRVQARSTGELKKVLHDDVEQLEEALAHGVPDGAAAAAVPVATTIALFVVDWRLALVALASLVLLVVVSAVGMRLAQRNNAALAEHSTTLSRAVMGYLQGIKVIRGYLRPDTGYDQARAAVIEAARLQTAATAGPVKWLVAAMTVATGLTVALLIPVAGLRFTSGELDLATLVLFLLLALGYLTPVMGLVGTLATILVRIQLAAGTITEILAEDPLPAPAEPVVPERFDVEFDDVRFAYREDAPVLDGISLTAREGETLALVGRTGSGKSTLARLVARFSDVDSGAVRIGGVDVRQIPSESLAGLVAFIQQDEYVFAASLLENIRIARPDATDAESIAAAERAQLGDVAAALFQGWATELPAGGGVLSGGERQRIAIARAILKDARILVLDEITASLDATTERNTLEALDEVIAGRTVIAIAHRLSTIQHSAQIAYLDQGVVAATGDHEGLLETCTPYRELWHSYRDAAGWRLEASTAPVPAPAPATNVAENLPDSAADEWGQAARSVVRAHIGGLGFARQWRALYGRSWQTLWRRGFVRLIAESLVRGAPLIAVFVIVMAAIGEGWAGGLDASLVWTVTALLAGMLVLRLLASVWSNALVWRLSARSKADLQLSVLERLRRVPLGFFGRVDNGRIATLVGNDTAMIDFQNVPQQIVGGLVQPVYAMIILLVIDWRLALAALIGLPLFWLLTVWSDRIHHRAFADLYAARQEATVALLDQARGAAVLRGNPGSAMAARYDTAISRLSEASTAMSVRATPATALGSIAVESGQVVLIVVGAGLYATGAVPAVTLLAFLFLSLTIYQPIQELMMLAGYRRNQQQIAAKIGEIWDAPVLSEPERPIEPADGSVEFRDVSFTYDGASQPVLTGVSFRAEPGQITALVGPSGSGKSTIAHLAARLWDVPSGHVLLGGVPVTELGSDRVMAQVAVVHQDVYLFDDTVRHNLALGHPHATDDELWAALEAAQCDDVVRALPHGLDTVLHDGGTDLSGGQRQRLAIARALLKDAPVLILDEAVAAVDPGTEDRIQRALSSLVAGRTVLVIAHRLTTIAAADRIVVVEHGRIAGIGTHTKLLGDCPAYADLAAQQGAS